MFLTTTYQIGKRTEVRLSGLIFVIYYKIFVSRLVLILAFMMCAVYSGYGQDNDKDKGELVPAVIVGDDTIPMITLPSVVIVSESEFRSKKESYKYRKLKRDVKKVYPYAKLARQKLEKYESELAGIDKKRDRKKTMKKVEKELKEEYGDELKNLTISQGQILLKLIDRETGQTSYELVKELRGVLSAFFWQTMAGLVGSSLKVEYDPNGADADIEHIVIMIENGLL